MYQYGKKARWVSYQNNNICIWNGNKLLYIYYDPFIDKSNLKIKTIKNS